MKRKRHWTVYVILVIVLISVAGFAWSWLSGIRDVRFDQAVTEAGGVVHYDGTELFSFSIPNSSGFASFSIGDYYPVAVEISSGSHPIPEELGQLRRRETITSLSLNTNQADDYIIPVISTFRYIEKLDLSGSAMTADGIVKILDALPGLKECQLTRGNFSSTDLLKLRSHTASAKILFK